MKYYFYILFFIVFSFKANAQSSIVFSELSLESAIAKAEAENKNIFIDTYAEWCIPCKRMDKVFRDNEVSALFNKHYINVRINMDYSPFADEYRKIFDIIFLPTMIILDKEGIQKYSIDKEIAIKDLLNIARICLDPSIYFESDVTKIVDNPISISSNTNTSASSNKERILHRLGNNDNVANPDFLYQEAYFRLELMDGSYKEIAKKYLGTQSDWGTDKNMKFIFDFVNNPDSKSFKYLIDNRTRFEELFGKEQVQITIQILIYNKLYQGVPRPSLNESINLFKLINKKTATVMAYEYYLSRIYDECKEDDYQNIAKQYLNEINPHNVDVIYNLAEIISHQPNASKDEISDAIKMMERNLENRKYHPEYLKLIAILSFKNDNKKQALKYIDDAIKLAKQKGLNLSSYLQLKQQYI